MYTCKPQPITFANNKMPRYQIGEQRFCCNAQTLRNIRAVKDHILHEQDIISICFSAIFSADNLLTQPMDQTNGRARTRLKQIGRVTLSVTSTGGTRCALCCHWAHRRQKPIYIYISCVLCDKIG